MNSVIESRGIQYSAEAEGIEGSLRCHVLRREMVHDRRAQFTIVVWNDSGADARALAFVPGASGDGDRTIVQTIVEAGSNFSTNVMLVLADAGTTPELHVAVTTYDTRFTLIVPGRRVDESAPELSRADMALAIPAMPFASSVLPALPLMRNPYPPPYSVHTQRAYTVPGSLAREPARSRASPPVVPIVLFFAALLVVVGFFLIRPTIGEFAVPQNVAAGTDVLVSYRVTGLGSVDYAMLGPDGRTLVAGPLAVGNGSFRLSLPRASAAQAFLIRLRASGPLGAATAENYVRVAASPAPSPTTLPRRPRAAGAIALPQIRSLALDRASLASGDTLNVYYDVLATSGSITLFDPASQIAYGRTDVTASGHASLIAPRVDTTRFLTVIITAQRGRITTQSRIGVTVTPQEPANGFTDRGLAAPDPAGGSATALFAPASVRSGERIHIEIQSGATGLQIALLDRGGNEVARHDVPYGRGSIDFTAPAVRTPSRFVIEGTYPSGAGSETIVRPIIVTP